MQPTPVSTAPAPAPAGRPVTWWWFLLPLLTFGMASFVMVLAGGVRLRSKAHLAAAGGYVVLAMYFFVAVQLTPAYGGSLPDWAPIPAFIVLWTAGTAHVVLLQTRVREAAPAASPTPWPLATRRLAGPDPAIVAALSRLRRREEARGFMAADLALAAELRIGRPDLPRQYDDGGLVDVNHVPAAVLAAELDLRADTAAAIVSQRDRIGGFTSAEDLMVYADGLTPERLEIIAERLLFVPL